MNVTKKELNKYLLIVDLCSLIISFFLTIWIRYGGINNYWYIDIYKLALVMLLLLYIIMYYLNDPYIHLFKRGYLEEMIAIVKINGWLAITTTVIIYFYQEGATYSRFFVLCFFVLNILITYIARLYYKVLYFTVYNKSNLSIKIMIITTSDQAYQVLKNIKKENEWEYQVTYLTILDKNMEGEKIEGIPVKADFITMFYVAKQEVLDEVFIYIPSDYPLNLNLEDTILEFENMGITVNLSINTFGLKIHEKMVQEISGYHVLTFASRLFNQTQLNLKRLMDIVGGLVGCLITVILTLFIAPAILIESPGPVFFSQIRVGRNGRRFKIYKYRSMCVDAETQKEKFMQQNEMRGYMFKISNDPRATKVGKFLRKTSLDEFPQFYNILKGDMSLVGTRPPTEEEFLKYEGRHKRRLALKSGLTGLWQVSGRNDISNFEDVVKKDLEYIDNWSFKMDLKILLKTVGIVLFRIGAR